MNVVEELGDALAKSTLEAMETIDDDRFYEKVSRVVGASSPTLQEAFLTAVRVRMAERRGREFLAKALAAAQTGAAAPDAPKDYETGGH
ncbi:hypothetical protein SAMN05216227_100329 [Pseudorhodobacter antarcticus]|jgi:hypothetical protein|uniref:Uncharacterized protein n=1 Tax=Pseudorhodobacter antarcticus TaxID=1077947 RepID=A0A1H8BIS2_9RHOB|nr:hypothetical protein [Pseudorhodobacter antarcticus]SEM82379.1 hypothetical protein SAMN05216227_100329 [Pseudorhodobacter antarcticus]